MEISDKLLCLFSADVSSEDGRYVVEVPRREVEAGAIAPGETYRVAVIGGDSEATDTDDDHDAPEPPVDSGEVRYVEIEDLGKQGDGIARVERGYVIIVPDTAVGERVKVEITEVKSNFAVGAVIEEDL